MRLGLFFLAAICMCSFSAQAKNAYFGTRVGTTDVRETEVIDKFNTTGFGSVYLGGNISVLRFEGEYTFAGKVKYSTLDLTHQSQRLMANGYVDLHVSRYVRPFLGLGAGTTFYSVESKTAHNKSTGTNFTWNASAGVGIRLTRNLTFDIGYRYVDMGDVDIGQQNLHFNSQEMFAGIRFLF